MHIPYIWLIIEYTEDNLISTCDVQFKLPLAERELKAKLQFGVKSSANRSITRAQTSNHIVQECYSSFLNLMGVQRS